jgi:hypothetical protein
MGARETGLGGPTAQDGDAPLADLLSYTVIGILSSQRTSLRPRRAALI